jgi:hypothetical protein
MKNFGPRIGFAYSVNPKTVVRASYNVNIARGDWTSGSQSGSPATLGLTPGASAPAGLSSAPAFYWDNTACTAGVADSVACGWTGSVVAPAPPAGGTSLAEYGTGNTVALGLPATGSTSLTYFDPYRGSRTPQYENWSFGIQRQLTKDMSITVSYVGSQGHFIKGGYANPARTNKLTTNFAALAGYNLNGANVTACGPTTCGFGTGNTDLLAAKFSTNALNGVTGLGFTPPNPYPVTTGSGSYLTSLGVTGYFTAFPQFAGVSDTTGFNGNTNYHALQMTVRQRTAHGLDFMLNYTYSKSMDDLGTFRLNDNARLDRSISVTSQPQNLTGTAVYKLPFGHGKIGGDNFLVNAIGGGWSLSGIFSYHSGSPLVATGSGCGSAPLGQCMPSIVPGVAARTGSFGSNVVANPAASNYYAKVPYLNTAAFSVNQPGTDPSLNGGTAATAVGKSVTNATGTINYVGNGTALYVPGNAARVGADNVWSMGYYDLDLGVKQTFKIWENVNIQVEADLLNATNHVVWGSINGGVGGSSYGFVGSLASQPRDAQLSGRINW